MYVFRRLVAGAVLFGATNAAGAPPPLTRSDYDLEFFQGPCIAANRVQALGCAYVALAEGPEGAANNSASPAVRDAFSHRWFDYDVNVGIQFPGAFTKTDFDNRGPRSDETPARVGDFLSMNLGGQLQFGDWGVSATGDLQQYTLAPETAGSPGLTMRFARYKLLGAYRAIDGQLVVGAGARGIAMQITQQGGIDPGTILTMNGVAPEVGALVAPNGRQWRIGATLRAPVESGTFGFGSNRATREEGGAVVRAGSFVLPSKIVLPWEAEFGVAYQLGPRPLNPRWINPHDQEAAVRARVIEHRRMRVLEIERLALEAPEADRERVRAELLKREESAQEIENAYLQSESDRLYEIRRARYENWPREKILLVASLLVTGPSENAVSVRGFLDRGRELVGESVSLTPRLGLEGEPIHNRLRGRVGTYLEPSRYDGTSPRQHFTFGTEIRLFPFNLWGVLADTMWRVSLFVDVAPRYGTGGVAIGTWH